MNVLGVHIGHDSSAAIVADGAIIADVAEERFSRVKHDAGLPARAIESVLEIAALQMKDIEVVAVATEQELWPLNELFDLYGGPHEQARNRVRAANVAGRLSGRAIRPTARRPTYAPRFPLANRTELVKVSHHLAHAAAAYYTSGDDGRQLIVTLDGVGDGLSGAVWRGERGRIEPLAQFPSSGSLGWFYGNVTEALGWAHGDGEGTTMALAAYGDPDPARAALERFHPRFEAGELVAPHGFGRLHGWNDRGAYEWHSDEAAEITRIVKTHGRENVAATAQRVLEEQVGQIAFPWLQRDGSRMLSCSGGVFLNVRLNQRIRGSGRVDQLHIYPNPGDAGLAVGAALYAYHQVNPGAQIAAIRHLYLGPGYSNEAIGKLLKSRGLEACRCDDVLGFAALKLAEDQVVGWFQGRMESGPRALGNRSILASPSHERNRDVVNTRVKFREPFRPYGPSLLAERAGEYLQFPRTERFMITSFDVREDKRESIPAVVHVDGTVRPQTVEHDVNRRFHELIGMLAATTGDPVVLNTSLNLRGEPIACHPRDAIRTFYDSGMDCLIIGDWVLEKPARC